MVIRPSSSSRSSFAQGVLASSSVRCAVNALTCLLLVLTVCAASLGSYAATAAMSVRHARELSELVSASARAAAEAATRGAHSIANSMGDIRKSPCTRVSFMASGRADIECEAFEELEILRPDCTGKPELVPRIYHSVGKETKQTHMEAATAAINPGYVRRHHDDKSAAAYVREKCGKDAAHAYDCLVPPAYRADLFRFCAMYADGGVYIDEDIVPLRPLEEIYSPCSIATVGHDMPQAPSWRPGKQMKIVASAPAAPIFKCALDSLVENVRTRFHPQSMLELSGPLMLQKCYEKHNQGVAVTYKDTRDAVWPYTGMRDGTKLLAYEAPSPKHFGGIDVLDYAKLYKENRVYTDTCPLHV